MASLEDLPTELIGIILGHLESCEDYISFIRTSRAMMCKGYRGQSEVLLRRLLIRLVSPEHINDAIFITRIRQIKRDRTLSKGEKKRGFRELRLTTLFDTSNIDRSTVHAILVLQSHIDRLTESYASREWARTRSLAYFEGF